MSRFEMAPAVRPRLSVGCLFDIPSGRYHTGKYGDSILNGGFSNFIGIGGRGNTFKTALSLGLTLTALDRYPDTQLIIYDAEITFAWDRIEDMSMRYTDLDYNEAVDSGRIILTSAGEMSGNVWWGKVREESQERTKDKKRISKPTPFIDRDRNFIPAIPLQIHFLDSMSQLETDAVAEIYNKNQIDDSAANTDALRGAAIKTRLVMQVPAITTQGGLSLVATAHVGDEMKLDPYAPAKQQLAFLKKGLKFKNTPEKFTFLTSNCWVVTIAEPLLNKTTKAAEYPLEGYNQLAGDTDLQRLSVINIRNKSGQTGQVLPVIVSQTEGLLPGLTQFNYLKERKDKFGLTGPEGQQKSYRLALYPEPLLARTKVRALIDEDITLNRALEITSEMCQMYDYWPDLEERYRVDPQVMYDQLKNMGYDWDILLNTRGYWSFDHYEHDVQPLSTMDLLKMVNNEYVPFWYPDQDKLKVDTSKLELKDGRYVPIVTSGE